MTNLVPSLVATLPGKTLVGLTPILAQATGGDSTAQLKQGFSTAMGILFMFGFFWGVIKIWSGANAISKGDADGKSFPLGAVPFGATLTYVLLLRQGKPPGYDRDLFELWITGHGFGFNAGDQHNARKRK